MGVPFGCSHAAVGPEHGPDALERNAGTDRRAGVGVPRVMWSEIFDLRCPQEILRLISCLILCSGGGPRALADA
jgi:hypothetical protein